MLATVPLPFETLYHATCDAISAGISAKNAASVSKDVAESVVAEIEQIETVSKNINDARFAANTAMVAACSAAEAAEKAASFALIVLIEAKKIEVAPNRFNEANRMIDIAISAFNAATSSAKSAKIFSEIATDASKVASETTTLTEAIDQAYISVSAAENIFKTANVAATNAVFAGIAGNSIIYFAGAPVISFSFRGDRRNRILKGIPDDVRNLLSQCQLAFFPMVEKKEIADGLFREIWNGAVFDWTVTPEFKQTLIKMSMNWEISLGSTAH